MRLPGEMSKINDPFRRYSMDIDDSFDSMFKGMFRFGCAAMIGQAVVALLIVAAIIWAVVRIFG